MSSVRLTSITIDPINPSIAAGTIVQLHATGNYSNGTTRDLTTLVRWTSADATIAEVSNAAGSKGLVTGASVGGTTIYATWGGVRGSTTLTVTPAILISITIVPANPSIAKGTMVELTASGGFSDGTTQDLTNSVTWASADSTIAQVSDTSGSKGQVTGQNIGTTSITATQAGVTGTTNVTVTAAILTSITIAPVAPSIAKGTTVQLTATGNFSDGTTQDLTTSATWSSTDGTIAQVGNTNGQKGLVTGLNLGSAFIAASQNGVQGSTSVTVTAARLTAITVDPVAPSIAKGTTVQLMATGIFTDGTTQDLTSEASWTSADETIAQVSDVIATKGLVTGIGVGSAAITATFDGIQGSATVNVTAATLVSITVTPANPSIAKGTTVQLTATGHFSDATTEDLTSEASWTSADETIAQVSNVNSTKGLVTGIGVGSAAVTATFDGLQGSATVNVTAATLVSITVTPANPSIAKGTTVQLTATGHFSDATTEDLTSEASWTSADETIAQVSNVNSTKGLVTGIGVGSATITATFEGIQGSTTVTVTPAILLSITITPANPTMNEGDTLQLTATGNFSDGTTQDLTGLVDWTSSDTGVAHVISSSSHTNGRVFARRPGTTTITALFEGVEGSTLVTVIP